MANKVRRFKITNHEFLGLQPAPFIIDMDENARMLSGLIFWKDGSLDYFGDAMEYLFSERNYQELKPAIIGGMDFLSAKVRVLEFKQELMIKNLTWNTNRKLKEEK